MDAILVLDLLLALIVLLFVPLGVWRGATKEAVLSAGILLGAAIADAWAARWGGELADWLSLDAEAVRFWVAAACVVLAALALGYGGGAVIGPYRPTLRGRLLGGLLAALNGTLLLGLALTFIERYFLGGEPVGALDDGPLAWTLLHRFDWFLVAAALLLLPCVAAGLLLTGRAPREAIPIAPAVPEAAVDRLRPVRVPSAADAGKYEPARSGADTWSVGRGTTEPHRGSITASSWPEPDPRASDRANGNGNRPTRFGPGRGLAPNGTGSDRPTADEWLRRAAAMTRPAEADDPDQRTRAIANPTPASHAPDRQFAPDTDEAPPDAERSDGSVAAAGAHGWSWPPAKDAEAEAPGPQGDAYRCLTCGASVTPSDVFCAECGAAV